MFAKSSTIGLIVLATLLSASQTQAQQNSTVFPWNSGYGGGTTPQSIISLKSSWPNRFTRTRMQSPSPWRYTRTVTRPPFAS